MPRETSRDLPIEDILANAAKAGKAERAANDIIAQAAAEGKAERAANDTVAKAAEEGKTERRKATAESVKVKEPEVEKKIPEDRTEYYKSAVKEAQNRFDAANKNWKDSHGLLDKFKSFLNSDTKAEIKKIEENVRLLRQKEISEEKHAEATASCSLSRKSRVSSLYHSQARHSRSTELAWIPTPPKAARSALRKRR